MSPPQSLPPDEQNFGSCSTEDQPPSLSLTMQKNHRGNWADSFSQNLSGWQLLFVLQAIICLLVFREFITGDFFFAYIDIGSDSYFQAVPFMLYLARQIPIEGFPGWSFQIGLGNPLGIPTDPFLLLNLLGGPDGVLPLRIWTYMLKIVCSGMAMHAFLRMTGHKEGALLGAIMYSFCGYMITNGQWDPSASEVVFCPLLLWAIARQHLHGGIAILPLTVALSLTSVFFVSVGVFFFYAAILCILASERRREMLMFWLLKVVPLVSLGYLIASPYLIPEVMQRFDGARVSGSNALFSDIFMKSLSLTDWQTILFQLGGLLHKDVFGIGSFYNPSTFSFFNYLEGPEFYVGTTTLLVIPQLWRGSPSDRRWLIVGLSAVIAYMLFPVFRLAAMGFAANYFRISNLWVSMGLIFLAVRVFDVVKANGLGLPELLAGEIGIGLLILTVFFGGTNAIFLHHLGTILVFASIVSVALMMFLRERISFHQLQLTILILVILEIVTVARPSYMQARQVVTAQFPSRDPLETVGAAVRRIKEFDPDVYRLETNMPGQQLCDALSLDFMGEKSYYYHASTLVDFYGALGISGHDLRIGNRSNWLGTMGYRFPLHSLVGMKYLISQNSLPDAMPGFSLFMKEKNYLIYRNDLALPLGIVQNKQLSRAKFNELQIPHKDIALINAVIVEDNQASHEDLIDMRELFKTPESDVMARWYIEPAKKLQQTGLKIEYFSSNFVRGKINPSQNGILVFSIPFNRGWSLKIDGQEAALFKANLGMLAAEVSKGSHQVELKFQRPGLIPGLWIGAISSISLLAYFLWSHRRPKITLSCQ
jgi:hypothetical protein